MEIYDHDSSVRFKWKEFKQGLLDQRFVITIP